MNVTIIGGGIAGPSLAIGLKKLGYNVTLYEAHEKIKEAGGAIGVTPNGFRMLNYVDTNLQEHIIKKGSFVEGLKYYNKNGHKFLDKKLDFLKRYKYPLVGIKRHDLQNIFLEKAEELKVNIVYGKRFKKLLYNNEKVKFLLDDKSEIETDILFGCDGNKSKVRDQISGKKEIEYVGLTATIGISKIPNDFKDNNCFNIFRNEEFNFLTYKVNSEECVWVSPNEEKMEPENWKNVKVKELESYDYLTNNFHEPVPSIVKNTKRCLKVGLFDLNSQFNWFENKVCLLGDAAHPMSPFLGQGANLSLEDVGYLLYILKNEKTKDIDQVFKKFQEERQSRALKIMKNSRIMGRINFSKSDYINLLYGVSVRILFNTFGLSLFDPIYGYDFKK